MGGKSWDELTETERRDMPNDGGRRPRGVIFDPTDQVIHVEGGNIFTDPPIAVR